MKNFQSSFFTLFFVAIFMGLAGCSTSASFKIPAGTSLVVDNIPLSSEQTANYSRSPFFWKQSSGITYQVQKNGKVIQSGKLKAKFRVVSIFWPPAAIIYWPMGFQGAYDLTTPNASVRPEGTTVAPAPVSSKKTK